MDDCRTLMLANKREKKLNDDDWDDTYTYFGETLWVSNILMENKCDKKD